MLNANAWKGVDFPFECGLKYLRKQSRKIPPPFFGDKCCTCILKEYSRILSFSSGAMFELFH
jgi:hypothetical protein